MSYISKWFQKEMWDDRDPKTALPKLECCGMIVEEHKIPKSLAGFHGDYVVYKRL